MKKLVIIGGGFAGSLIAKNCENYFDTTLIDSKDFFEFTPGILRTIVQPSHAKKIQVLHKEYLKKTNFIRSLVTNVDKKYVSVKDKKIPYDYLVIASGSSYVRLIKELDTVLVSRIKTLQQNYDKLLKAKKVLIIGGSFVGVELAAEIATHFPDKNITIIEATPHLISRNNPKASTYAEDFMKKHNVKFILEEKIIEKNKTLLTDKWRKVNADIIFSCVGIKPNSLFMEKNFKDKINEHCYLKVNDYLQLAGFNNIFVAGDVTDIKEEKLAQNAENHAYLISKNLKLLLKNKSLIAYNSKPRIMVISLGKLDGILIYKQFTLTGIIPGIMKTVIEKMFMRKL
ncbi:FAD-dependent oxidoreductase [Candidatus Pacearchaeota archaeon]|nr:FAD-dependent oxidoreductase [Candidatus Pacearchaeota archaeon]